MFQEFTLKEVNLTDSVFLRRKNLVKEYLRKFDIESLMYNFKKNAGIFSGAHPLGGWEAPDCDLRGHFAGHFLSACAKFAYGDEDEILAEKARNIVDIMYLCKKENGYLSAFPESVLDELEKEENRNVWAPYYTLHKILQGLVDCNKLLGNERALILAVNLAKYIKRRFERLSFWKTDAVLRCTRLNPANEFGGLGVSLYQLYEITKDEEILELARLFDREYFIGNLSCGNDILEDLHANTHLPMVLAAMYRYEITGESKYRAAAENFYQYVKGRCFANGNSSSKAFHYIPGSVSERAEHWGRYGMLQDALTGEESESCCAHNTEKILEKLFLWNGKRSYLDHLERWKYNAVLNCASSITGLSQYHQPMRTGSRKKFSGKYDTFWCCTGSGVEAMSELQKNIWYKKDTAVLINMFIPSKVFWKEKEMVIEQKTEYPVKSSVEYIVHVKEPVCVKLMWKKNRVNKIWYNNKLVEIVHDGEYCFLEKKFCECDKVEIELVTEKHTEELPGANEKQAVLYDQILLARIEEKSGTKKRTEKDTVEKLQRENMEQLSFIQKTSEEQTFRWVPLYTIENEIYTVYRG